MTSSLHRITSVLLLCLPLVSWSAELKGRVVVVVDGDTLVVLDSSNTNTRSAWRASTARSASSPGASGPSRHCQITCSTIR